jgi:hypothetical protein
LTLHDAETAPRSLGRSAKPRASLKVPRRQHDLAHSHGRPTLPLTCKPAMHGDVTSGAPLAAFSETAPVKRRAAVRSRCSRRPQGRRASMRRLDRSYGRVGRRPCIFLSFVAATCAELQKRIRVRGEARAVATENPQRCWTNDDCTWCTPLSRACCHMPGIFLRCTSPSLLRASAKPRSAGGG